MADVNLLKILRAKPRSLALDNRGLSELPNEIGKLVFLHSLSVKNNRLSKLPSQIENLHSVSECHVTTAIFIYLTQLTYLNVGGNVLRNLPLCLCKLTNLQTLYAFNNHLSAIPSQLLSQFVKL